MRVGMKRAYLGIMQTGTKYQVVFRGNVVGTYSTRKRACAAADRKDLAHGSYAHSAREVGDAPTHTHNRDECEEWARCPLHKG